MTTIEIEGDDTLMCPNCGGIYLHHVAIDTYSHREDVVDPARVQHVHIEVSEDRDPRPGDVRIDSDISAGLCRRGSLTITFTCEGCNARPRLLINQHKGHTLLSWLAAK